MASDKITLSAAISAFVPMVDGDYDQHLELKEATVLLLFEMPSATHSSPENIETMASDSPVPNLKTTNNTTDLLQEPLIGENEGKKTKKIIRKKRRPARPQVDPSTMKSEPPPQSE